MFPWLIFNFNILGVRASVITDQFCHYPVVNNQLQKLVCFPRSEFYLDREGKKKRRVRKGCGVIILFFSVKGRWLFEEIPYVVLKKTGLRMTWHFVFFKQVNLTLAYVKKGWFLKVDELKRAIYYLCGLLRALFGIQSQ